MVLLNSLGVPRGATKKGAKGETFIYLLVPTLSSWSYSFILLSPELLFDVIRNLENPKVLKTLRFMSRIFFNSESENV